MSLGQSRPSRRLVSSFRLLLLVAIFITAAEPRYIRLLLSDRSSDKRTLERLPDRFTPELPRFLEIVRRATPQDATIGLAVPMRAWGEGYANGYSYAYYRARYLLAGRRVVPLVTPEDRQVIERVAACDYIAAWHVRSAPAGFRPLLEAAGGTLYVRQR